MTTTRPSLRFRSTTSSLFSLVAAATLALSACGGSGGKKMPDGGPDASGTAGTTGGAGAGGAPADGGGDTSTACVESGTGTLVVAVNGLPSGATMPMIRVASSKLPNSMMMLTVGAPVMVPAGGGYDIQYRRVKVAPEGSAIVGKAFYASTSFDGCVKPTGTTTVTLNYTQEPGSEHLWIGVSNAPPPATANMTNEIGGFASADLAATAAKNPAIWKTNHFVGRPGAGAFDSFGNFWVPGGDVVNMYSMLKLAMPGDVAPDVVLTQPTGAPATFAAFDSNGNLWVSRGAPANTVVRYTPDDQAASGSPVPAVAITSADLANPAGLAFDANGDLWVACEASDKVLRFNHEHLNASYAGAADYAFTAKTAPTAPVTASYTAPNGIAFDQAGTLWVGYVANLVGIAKANQSSTMATQLIEGPIALNISAGTGGFAFDQSGGLWLSGGNPGIFQRLPAAMLAATGDVTPDIVITSSELGYAETLVLDPAPMWSPIQDSH
jgi:sugar lactone lactonase YvrE